MMASFEETVEFEFEVFCEECGRELTTSCTADSTSGGYGGQWKHRLKVPPCEYCVESAKEEAIEDYKDQKE
jgi:hypothetical protein